MHRKRQILVLFLLLSSEIVSHRTHAKMTFPVVVLPCSFHSPCPQKISYSSRIEHMQDLNVTSVGLDYKVHEKKRGNDFFHTAPVIVSPVRTPQPDI